MATKRKRVEEFSYFTKEKYTKPIADDHRLPQDSPTEDAFASETEVPSRSAKEKDWKLWVLFNRWGFSTKNGSVSWGPRSAPGPQSWRCAKKAEGCSGYSSARAEAQVVP